MRSSRRYFLKMMGLSALGVGATPISSAFSSSSSDSSCNLGGYLEKDSRAIVAKQWCMVIDTRRISSSKDLDPLVKECHRIHNIPVSLQDDNHVVKWIWNEEFHHAFPDKDNEFIQEELKHKLFPVLCNHCEDPACVRACPTKATFKRPSDGIVLMDFHRCIGCRFCMAACPFGARSFNFRDPRPFIKDINNKFPTRMKGVVEKCNFCAERLAVGEMPACVVASNGIFTFGDLHDSASEVRKLLRGNYAIRRKQTLGTGPSVYYIV